MCAEFFHMAELVCHFTHIKLFKENEMRNWWYVKAFSRLYANVVVNLTREMKTKDLPKHNF